jgi:hypothetical protein
MRSGYHAKRLLHAPKQGQSPPNGGEGAEPPGRAPYICVLNKHP